jgi:hypothetical protein
LIVESDPKRDNGDTGIVLEGLNEQTGVRLILACGLTSQTEDPRNRGFDS